MKAGAVIILYHPEINHLLQMVDVLIRCKIHTVVVDNSSDCHASKLPSTVNYLHFPENVGIAAAQNAGLAKLQELDLHAAFLFDQDSHLTDKLLNDLLAYLKSCSNATPPVAAIGPTVVCGFTETQQIPKLKRQKLNEHVFDVSQIIASGMLINLRYLDDIGIKDETLFIDGVDHEWCWRARDKGYRILMAKDVTMFHKQGDARHTYWGVTFKRGAPIRLYYQVRNVLKLSRRSHVPLRWKFRQLAALPVRWLVNRFLFPEGLLRGKYMLMGFRDGIRNHSGKIKS